MSTKHTPGPWSIHRERIIFAEDGYAIADVTTYHGKRQEQTQANARLIAAAPELLGELKRAVAMIEEARSRGSKQIVPASMRAAIAKATGEG